VDEGKELICEDTPYSRVARLVADYGLLLVSHRYRCVDAHGSKLSLSLKTYIYRVPEYMEVEKLADRDGYKIKIRLEGVDGFSVEEVDELIIIGEEL